MSTQSCPLSDPNLGIITEQDHSNNQCICFMCTCGQHICPSSRLRPSGLSMYKTHYSKIHKNFKVSIPAQRPTYYSHRPPPQKMDFTTSNMDQYKDFKVTLTPEKDRPYSKSASSRFIGNSNYKSSFVNWGPNYIVLNKRPVYPVHSTNMKLNPNTSYNSQYYVKEKDTYPAIKSHSTLRPGQKPLDDNYVTTSHRNFKGQVTDVNRIVQRKPQEPISIAFASTQYNTETKKAFEAANNPIIDPQKLRRSFFR